MCHKYPFIGRIDKDGRRIFIETSDGIEPKLAIQNKHNDDSSEMSESSGIGRSYLIIGED